MTRNTKCDKDCKRKEYSKSLPFLGISALVKRQFFDKKYHLIKIMDNKKLEQGIKTTIFPPRIVNLRLNFEKPKVWLFL